MKTIPSEFTDRGFIHRQIKRVGRFAIFQRKKVNAQAEPHFEVVSIGSHNGYEIKTVIPLVVVPPGETYPTANVWGQRGWTLPTLERAQAKFRELITEEF